MRYAPEGPPCVYGSARVAECSEAEPIGSAGSSATGMCQLSMRELVLSLDACNGRAVHQRYFESNACIICIMKS